MQTIMDQAPMVGAAPSQATTAQGARVLIALFVLSLLIPSSWEIAGLRLDTARLYALCVIIPLALRWLSQEAGRPLPLDILIFLHGFWIIVSLAVNHGTERLALSGMTVVELTAGYFVGRILIRDPAAFRFLFQALLIVVAILLPFALYEMTNGRAILQEVFRSALGSAHGDVYHPPRMGLYRAQSVMQHPILWGVFCAIIVANAFYIWADRLPAGLARAGIAGVACFSSMSSGAVLNLLLQILLKGWGWVTKGAWKLLALAFLALYIFLSLASNRGPIILMIETLTFSASTGWARVHIWNHGIDDVLANPIFGIGLRAPTGPDWLTSSVDNFWLVVMLRHGLVGFGLLAAGFVWHIWKVATSKGLSAYERRLREGYMIALVALIFSLATVHFWGPPYLLMFAYIGAGVWFYAGPDRPGSAATVPNDAGNDDGFPGDRVIQADGRGDSLPFSRGFDEAGNRPMTAPPTRSPAVPTARPHDLVRQPDAAKDRPGFSRRLEDEQGRERSRT